MQDGSFPGRRARLVIGVTFAVAGAVAAGYHLRSAGAEGVPTVEPLWFAGTLTDGEGTPLAGSHTIGIGIYDTREVGTGTLVCGGPEAAFDLSASAGRFRVSLQPDAECVAAVQANSDLWIQAVVDGTPMPQRTKLGAVPYALEAKRAMELVPANARALVPPGTIVAFGGATAPDGWLLCDGSAISRTDYADLFGAIQTAFGAGDGSATFNLPDFRGRFLRGVAGTSTADPDKSSRTAMASGGNSGNAVGSVQAHAYASHRHVSGAMVNWTTYPYGYFATPSAYNSINPVGHTDDVISPYTSTVGGNETRPVNAYVNWIIKY
jgi:hypothetical protein